MKNLRFQKLILLKMSAYYSHPLNDLQIRMYAEDLAELSDYELECAFDSIRRDPTITKFPLPAAMKSAYESTKRLVWGHTSAKKDLEDIFGLALHYGTEQKVYVSHLLTETQLNTIRLIGGWDYVCSICTERTKECIDNFISNHIESSKLVANGQVSVLPLKFFKKNQLPPSAQN